ncbi:MAG: hypothetical protein RLZZ403_1826, partial [Pseudomonadota bacterium]
MQSLRNLSSSDLSPCPAPWDFTGYDNVPDECKGVAGKPARDAWINNPATEHQVYSLYQGVQPNLRCKSGLNTDETANPVESMSGLVVDYDADITVADAQNSMKLMGDIKPNYFEQTLSDHARLLWMFEETIRFPSRAFAIAFLKEIGNFIAIDRLPGLDRPCLMTPEKYFTNGGRWTKLSSVLVPANVLRGFYMRVAAK